MSLYKSWKGRLLGAKEDLRGFGLEDFVGLHCSAHCLETQEERI